jgi:hypothetical protein
VAGPKGDTGNTGPKGDKGDPGVKGDTGDVGPAGPASTVAGPKGDKGDPGVKGDTGATGPDGWNRIKLGSDQSSTVVAPADVPGLAFPALANTDYEFEFIVPFTTAATTTGLGLSLGGPAGPVFLAYRIVVPTSVTAETIRQANAYNSELLTTAIDAANAGRLATIKGILRNGANAGNVAARWRSEVAGSAAVIKHGALVKYRAV